MIENKKAPAWIARLLRGVVSMVLVACLSVGMADTAWAKAKKKEEVAAPTKSYTIPYMIVLALVGIGLMTVCRPTGRKDKPDQKRKDEEEE